MPGTVSICYQLELGPDLPPHIAEIARKQGENSDSVCQSLQQLKDMIYEKGDFPADRMDDAWLLKFLRARFFKVNAAYTLLHRYHTFREENKNFYYNIRPVDLTVLGDDDVISVAPYRDQNGRRMIIFKMGKWNPSKIPVIDLFRATLIVLEIGSFEPQAQVLGGIGLFDLEGLSFNHLWQMSPSVAQNMIKLMVTCVPMRTAEIHVVNNTRAFDTAFQFFKPFLNERMRERIYIHGTDMKSLHKHLHPEHLPSKYGGNHEDYPYTKWITSILKDEPIVKELKLLGYDVEGFNKATNI